MVLFGVFLLLTRGLVSCLRLLSVRFILLRHIVFPLGLVLLQHPYSAVDCIVGSDVSEDWDVADVGDFLPEFEVPALTDGYLVQEERKALGGSTLN